MALQEIPSGAIRTDGGTQHRGELDASAIAEYTEKMWAKTWDWTRENDPIRVVYDGKHYWLTSGYHRVEAAKRIGLEKIAVEVISGDQRTAVLDSVGQNADHGVRLSDSDKRRKVEVLLRDEEWRAWSDHRIAAQCKVSHAFVGRVREQLIKANAIPQQTQRIVQRGDSSYTMDTAPISNRAPTTVIQARSKITPFSWYPVSDAEKQVINKRFANREACLAEYREGWRAISGGGLLENAPLHNYAWVDAPAAAPSAPATPKRPEPKPPPSARQDTPYKDTPRSAWEASGLAVEQDRRNGMPDESTPDNPECIQITLSVPKYIAWQIVEMFLAQGDTDSSSADAAAWRGLARGVKQAIKDT